MEACPYCRISERPSSRIRAKIQANCVKNRRGACAACGKLASIDRRIEEARRVLNDLLDEREELARTLNDHHDPLTNRLPTEVVTNIFLHCQPTRPDPTNIWSGYPIASLLHAVLKPGHVCSQWRTISQNSPRLWSVLYINISSKTCIRSLEMVQHWLRYSGSTPLYVEICTIESGSTIRSFAVRVFTLITATAHRWEVLDLMIPGSLVQSFSDILAQRHLNLLDVLKLKCFGGSAGGVLSLNASPRVILNEGGESPILAGMERLVHFSLGVADTLDLDGYIRLFRTARGLSTCTIAIPEGYEPAGVTAATPVEAPCLHTITAREIHGNFWDHFVFPRLHVLHLNNHTAWCSLDSLLRRSQCSITELQLDIGKESLHIIVGLFEHLRHIETLLLEFPSPCDFDFFSPLDSLSSTNSKTLSKLVSLSCTVYDPLFEWSPLLVFLTNMRSRSEPSLRTFAFDYQKSDDDDEEGNWNEDTMPLPMDAQTVRLAFDATRNMKEAIIYDLNSTSVLEEYLGTES